MEQLHLNAKRQDSAQVVESDSRTEAPVKYRLHFALLVLAQIAILREVSLLKYMPLRGSSELLGQILSVLPALVKAFIIAGVAGLCISIFWNGKYDRNVIGLHRPRSIVIACNFLCFVALCIILLAIKVDNGEFSPSASLSRNLLIASPFLWIGMITSWAVMLAPLDVWRAMLRENYPVLILIFFVSSISFYDLDSIISEESGAFLTKPTLYLAEQLFSLTGEKLLLIGSTVEGFPIVGNDLFKIEIRPACTGYQGIILSLLFFTIYFYFERAKFAIWQIGLTVAAACAAVYALNALRIAALFYVGEHYSAEVAVKGFHTNFGLLSVICVVLATVALARLISARNKDAKTRPAAELIHFHRMRSQSRLLLPLVCLIGASLFTGLFSGEFAWWYPIPILAASIGLLKIRSNLIGLITDISPLAIVLGIIVFIAWIVIVPVDFPASRVFENTLFSASAPLAGGWLFFRLFGSVVVVPLAEELAFRGAFQELLLETFLSRFGIMFSSTLALILTSVGFGLMHTNILAGSLAGVAFGIARLIRGRLGDAVVAHGTTNLTLALYVLLGSRWSYWG